MTERRHPQVANLDELPARESKAGKKYEASIKSLGGSTQSKGIGCSWYEVPPGKTAFPYHYHTANEESLFILDGQGTLRIGEAEVPVRAGDYIALPVGPDSAHQLLNESDGTLRYLAFSTMNLVEVVGYPDSKKAGAMALPSREAAMKGEHWLRFLTFVPTNVGYFDGEEDE